MLYKPAFNRRVVLIAERNNKHVPDEKTQRYALFGIVNSGSKRFIHALHNDIIMIVLVDNIIQLSFALLNDSIAVGREIIGIQFTTDSVETLNLIGGDGSVNRH